MTHRIRSPRSRLVFVARGAGVRYLVFFRHRGGDELEGMRANKGARDALTLDLWHMTRHTLAAWAAVSMVSMLFHGCHVGTVG